MLSNLGEYNLERRLGGKLFDISCALNGEFRYFSGSLRLITSQKDQLTSVQTT